MIVEFLAKRKSRVNGYRYQRESTAYRI